MMRIVSVPCVSIADKFLRNFYRSYRMFHLNSSLLSGSDPWDTNYARKYLQISEDQLEKINKILGRSKTEISEKTATGNDKTLENIEKQLTQQASSSTENILTTNTNISAKDNDNLKNQNYNSDIKSKQNPVVPLNEKELFLKNVSLSPLKKKHTSATYSLQRSSSLPDLCKKLLPAEVLSHSNSEEIYRKQIHSIEKDISSFKLAPLLTKNILNKTYTVPGVSDDCLNHNKLLEISHKSFSRPLENPNRPSKQKFKTLDYSILNHKYLKDTETSVTTSDTVPLFSNGTVQTTLKQEPSLFEKKLLLLEKRLSPSKEMSPPPFNSKLINIENLNSKKNLKSSQIPAPADEVVTAVASSESVEDLPDEIENSSVSKSYKSFESQDNSQSINEKSDALKNTFKSAQDRTGDASKTAACNFESFLSPPLPCAQPVPTEVLSLSQPIPSQKLVELNTPSESQNASSPVPCGQLLPTEVPSLSQPILSQKSARLNTPSKSQNAELAGKIMAPEKPSDTFSVFSANVNEKVSDLASDKELGTKRKRKSRSEKSSKKLDVKKLKRTDIQFSSAQIKSMIEIMKIFHAEC
ncbi:hypothetical protein AVEN_62020-1 [Araneus ventricosus]|uniref:Uncharacterized protein n=1 Tax=Araneus ventricosus TaxID=182803 RepID=A0A4Y2EDC9_ARAVE|nr:hypothetical protein AVEN_62020-1 [Araneus ventricosus]